MRYTTRDVIYNMLISILRNCLRFLCFIFRTDGIIYRCHFKSGLDLDNKHTNITVIDSIFIRKEKIK